EVPRPGIQSAEVAIRSQRPRRKQNETPAGSHPARVFFGGHPRDGRAHHSPQPAQLRTRTGPPHAANGSCLTARLACPIRASAATKKFPPHVTSGLAVSSLSETQETVVPAISIAVVVGLALAANGTFMLVAPSAWYGLVPGVAATGPLNAHFVRDIGAAYLV